MTIKNNLVERILMVASVCLLAIGPAFAEISSPTDAYLNYLVALKSAQGFEELKPLLSKHSYEEIEQATAEQKPMLFMLMKAMSPRNVKVLSESVDGDNATLTATGTTEPEGSQLKEKTTGEVTLVKEDGAWKIGKENWKTVESAASDKQSSK